MKIKNYIALAAISLGLCAVASCTEGNDWLTDSAHNRVMTPAINSVTADSCALQVALTTYGGTSYEIEANVNPFPVDDLDGDVMEGSITSIVNSKNGVITGLNGYTDYYVRVRALADGKNPSHWILFAKDDTTQVATTTTGDQILNPIANEDRFSDAINISWIEGRTPTMITAINTSNAEDSVKTYILSADDQASHSFTCTNLNPGNYQIRIYEGEQCVGMRETSTTNDAKPDYIYTLEGDVINQALIDELAEKTKASAKSESSYTVRIDITGGKTVTVSGDSTSLAIPAGMSIAILGKDVKPTLVFPYTINIAGYHNSISFDNLNITTSGGDKSNNRYIINQSVATSTDKVSFTSCNIYDINASIVRLQSAGGSIGTVTLSDCVVTNQGSNSYAVVYNQATSGGIGEVNIENTTFDTCINAIVVNNSKNDTKINKITMTNCTIYNSIASGKYIFDSGKDASSKLLSTDVTLTGIVIGKLYTTTAKGGQTGGTLTLDHVYQTSDSKFNGGSLKSTDGVKLDYRTGTYSSDDLFKDAANHDFTLNYLYEQTSSDKKNGNTFVIYGDSRWRSGAASSAKRIRK